MADVYRVISALCIDLGPIAGGGSTSSRELIVNLARDGRNILKSGARPRPPKVRIVDVRPGDQILHDGQWLTVNGVKVFLERWMTAEQAAGIADDGREYLYHVASPPATISACSPLYRDSTA